MSLNFGTIYGSINLDTSKWTKGLNAAFKAGDQMVAKSKTTYGKGGDAAGAAFATGVQQNTKGLGAAIGRAADGAKAMFGKAGDRAGDGFADGVRTGLKGVDDAWRNVDGQLKDQHRHFVAEGTRAGAGFADGAGTGSQPIGTRLRESLNDKGSKLLLTSAAALGALVGATFAKAFIQNLEVERANDKLDAQLNLTPGRALVIGRVAGRLYVSGFGESMEQVNDAIKTTFQNGILPADAIGADVERISGKLLNLSDVLGQDVGLTAEAVGNILRNGLAKDADEAFDILTASIQAGADKAGDLTATFQEYSTQFRQMGLDGAEAAGLMVQGLQGGARDADVVADAIKEMALQSQGAMTKTTTVANTSAAALQRVVSAERNLEQQGRASMRAQQALTQARADAAQQIKDLADQTGDAALDEEQAAIAVLRAQERLNALPADASALDRREAVLGLRQAQEALGDQQKRVIELQDAQARANEAGVDGSEQVINAFYGVLEAQRDQGDATAELRAANDELANSYGGTRTELTALGQAYQDLGIDGVQAQRDIAAGGEPARRVLQRVLDALRGVEDPVKRNAIALAIFGTKAEDLQGALYNLNPDTAVAALGTVEGATDGLSEAYDNNASRFEAWKRDTLESSGGFLGGLAAYFDDGRFFDWDNFIYGWEAINNGFRLGWSISVGFFKEKWDKVTGWFSEGWDTISRGFTTAKNTITGVWNSIWLTASIAAGWVRTTWDGVVNWVTGLPDRITDAASGLWDGIKDAFKGAVNWIIDKWNGLSFAMPSIDTHIPGVGVVGGWRLDTPDIPRFHQGTGPGGVPGMPGQEVPALLLAGETVRTTSQERGLQQAMAQLGAIAANGLAVASSGAGPGGPVVGGGATVLNVNVDVALNGPVAGRDGKRWVSEAVNEGIRTGTINAQKMLRERR